MPILKFEQMTLLDLNSIPREKAVVFIPVGPLEQHGPHLPLGMDAFSATYFSEQMAERILRQHPETHCILFPTIFAGTDTLKEQGTIEVPPAVLRNYLYACCKHLSKSGFKKIIAVGAHGGPRHMVVLEEVAARMRWQHRTKMISASSQILFKLLKGNLYPKIEKLLQESGNALTSEEKSALKTDFHGGLLETSILLAARPEMVNPTFKSLKPSILKSIYKLSRNSLKTTGEKLGYLGTPALARPEIGQAVVSVLLDEVEGLILRFMRGEKVEKHFRSVFYYIPFFRTDFKLLFIIALYVFVFGITWWFLGQFLLEMYK